MAIRHLGLLPDDRRGRIEFKQSQLVYTYYRSYRIAATEDQTEAAVVAWAFATYRTHPVNPLSVAKSIEVSQDSEILQNYGTGWIAWIARCEYTSDETQRSNQSPLYPTTPADISHSFESFQMPVYKDLTGTPILNTAKEPYDPPYSIEMPIGIKTIKINLTYGDWEASDYLGRFIYSVNSDEYDGFAAGKWKVLDISDNDAVWTDEEEGVTIVYKAMTFKLGLNYLGWQPELLSQGFNELYDSGGGVMKLRAIRTPDGREYGGQAPLNAVGKALFGDDALDTAQVVFTKYDVFRDVSFAELNF